MELLKKFTCLVACFVVLSSSFMVGYAVDSPGYIFTKDDLLDLGYVFDDDTAFYLENKDPFDLGISLFRSKEKNYPDFDILKDIPWSSFPGYIQDIIYMSLDGLNTALEDEYGFIVPFVGVQVTTNGTVANVFVGTNVGLSYISNAVESFSIFSFLTYPEISQHSKLYRLRVDLINGNIVDWTEYKGEAFGDTGKLLRMLPWNTGNNTSVDDWYLYGANGVGYVYGRDNIGDIYDIGSVGEPSKKNLDSPEYVISNLSPVGFADGRFLPNQDVFYPYVYFQYFVPPSRESLQQQLQQEINNKLDDIMDATGTPDSIVDDYNDAESDLIDDYDPDNLQDDLEIELDSSALSFIWDLFDEFVTADYSVFTLFISILSIGIIALILGR